MKKKKNPVRYNTIKQLDRAVEKAGYPSILTMTNTVVDYDDSIYQEIERIGAVNRLNKVKQLGLAETCGYSACSSGTRLVHSLICASEIDLLAQKKGLEDRELGIIAGMTHDIASTPYSDSVSLGLNLSDEEQFEYVLSLYPAFDELLDRYSVKKRELVDVVTGKSNSIMGQLINSKDSLDIDRWSYSIYDAWTLDLIPRPPKKKKMRFPPFKNVELLCLDNRYVPKPFEHVNIDESKIVFTDLKSLSDTLELRVRMSTDVYNNPELLAKEAFLEGVSKNMMEKGVITKESLFRMGDEEFMRLVWKHGGKIGNKLFQFFKFASYGAVDADEQTVREFLESEATTPFVVKRQKRFNTAADSLVMVNGKTDTYRKWRPEYAESMEERMDSLNKTFVYGLAEDYKLADEVQKAQEKFGVV
jgi:HD superfamily phosphohydrolase